MHVNHQPGIGPSSLRFARLAGVALILALVTIVAGAPLSVSAAPEESSGGIGLRLLDTPTSTKDDPRARDYIVDHLSPGTVIERRVEVVNTTTSAQEVVLYSGAASIDDGTFTGSPGRTLNDLASWTTVTPDSATVDANGSEIAVATITVPDDAPAGERYGVVWAEARSDPGDDGGIVQVSRVGIRLYVSVGTGGAPAADFEIETLTAERSADGAPVVSAAVRNTGGRALDIKGKLVLRNGPGGLTAGPFPAPLASTLAIGATGSVRLTLDTRLPDGPWDATVTLESGLVERSAEAAITFPDSGAAPPVSVIEESAHRPWAFLLGAGALPLLLVVGGLWVRGRRRS